MSCSPALKVLIALLLPLTLGWKLTVHPDDTSELSDSLVEFFARHHFVVLVTEDNMGQSPVIQATACRLLAGKISPDGNNWEPPDRFAAPTDHIFVVFRGRASTPLNRPR
jgi:hypothetical protein